MSLQIVKKSEQNKLYFVIFISLMLNSVNVHDILAVMKVVTFFVTFAGKCDIKVNTSLVATFSLSFGEKIVEVPDAYGSIHKSSNIKCHFNTRTD